jgi:fatty acid desaturase
MNTAISSEPRLRDKPLNPAMLRELSARSDFRGVLRTISHYGAVAIVGTLIWLVASTWGVAWALPLIPAQAYLVAFLFMPMRETAHKTAFRSRALNLAVGHLSAFMIAHRYE